VAFGGIITVTQVSNASTRSTQRALANCNNVKAPSANQSKYSTETKRGASYKTNKGKVTHHPDDGAQSVPSASTLRERCRAAVAASTKAGNNNGGTNNARTLAGENPGGVQGDDPGAQLGVIANDCENSVLDEHDGFQNGNRCVSTQFGEVAVESKNPTLLITEAPDQVDVNEGFELKVSTRNLQRDRFLAAGQGGYYVESALLQQDGIERGHFHTACRMLESTDEAPESAPAPAFFVATEDGRGGVAPDEVTINVPGLPEAGLAQCASWAGDGSHRIPMMQRANQIPGFDVVKIQVGNGGGNNNNDNNNGNNNNGNNNNDGNNTNAGGNNGGVVKTINCPTVADKVGNVPGNAQNEVMRNLALLETQIKEAQTRLNNNGTEGGANFVNNAILGPLESKRGATLDRIRISVERAGGQAPNIGGLAKCTAA
jgi:hypothetical protein